MPECIYCRETKSDNEFTLEHVIPQFLGGAQAPDELKTRDVCGTCNSNLGLFVDAAFEKDFLVYTELIESAYAFFNPEKPAALPLRYMGASDVAPPDMKDDEICECWLGPLGEQIYWIRPKDDRMYWYSGGNPRTVKKIKTRAYFLFAERSQKNPLLTWLAFKDAFSGRRVKKIMCGTVEGADPKAIGFSEPDKLDKLRSQYITDACDSGQQRKFQLSMYIRYDVRFMAKLALGMSHVLFGHEIRNSGYANELYKALWFKEGDAEPSVQGVGVLSSADNFLEEHCGVAHGVTITVLPASDLIGINLNLSRKMNWSVVCAKIQDLTNEQIEKIKDGICVVLFKSLDKGVRVTLPELIAHNLGNIQHPELAEIEHQANIHSDYFQNL